MSTPLSPSTQPGESRRFAHDEILTIVLDAIRVSNQARDAESQLASTPEATLFGPGSPLDSLGLVALLLDIEDELHSAGCPVALSDERAMSQKRSPFRSVASLVAYVSALQEV